RGLLTLSWLTGLFAHGQACAKQFVLLFPCFRSYVADDAEADELSHDESDGKCVHLGNRCDYDQCRQDGDDSDQCATNRVLILDLYHSCSLLISLECRSRSFLNYS